MGGGVLRSSSRSPRQRGCRGSLGAVTLPLAGAIAGTMTPARADREGRKWSRDSARRASVQSLSRSVARYRRRAREGLGRHHRQTSAIAQTPARVAVAIPIEPRDSGSFLPIGEVHMGDVDVTPIARAVVVMRPVNLMRAERRPTHGGGAAAGRQQHSRAAAGKYDERGGIDRAMHTVAGVPASGRGAGLAAVERRS
jgi:hypothetical protein